MGQFIKRNLVTIAILGATLVLAGIAVFTAIRLYQLRQQPVAPTAPESKPGAQATTACQALTFTLTQASPTPTPTPLPGCYETCTTPGSQSDCPTGLTCQTIGASNICVNPSCSSSTNCICPTPTPSPSPTPVPTPTPTATPTTPPGGLNSCNGTCGSDSNCQSGMICYITSGATGVCRNPSCVTSTSCVCGTSTPLAQASPTPTPIPPTTTRVTTTPAPQLPQAGVSGPTILGISLGAILLLGAVLLAL